MFKKLKKYAGETRDEFKMLLNDPFADCKTVEQLVARHKELQRTGLLVISVCAVCIAVLAFGIIASFKWVQLPSN